jgi:hypothetical protein
MTRAAGIAASTLCALALLVAPAWARVSVGVRADGALAILDTSSPATALESRTITGLAAGYVPDDVDVRPATGQLYLLATDAAGGGTSNLALYTLDPGTGAAALVGGGPFATGVTTAGFGIDFDGSDRLRVVSDDDLNLTVDPGTAVATAGPPLVHPTATEDVTSIAFASSLYGWDPVRRRIVTVGDSGAVADVSGSATGPSASGSATGFDAAPDGAAFLTAGSTLYGVDLGSGSVSSTGALAQPLAGFALLNPVSFDLPDTTLTVPENAGAAEIAVTRSSGAGTMTVRYSTSDGSATIDDYDNVAGTLTFGPGVTKRSFQIPIVQDSSPEPAQTVGVSLTRPTGGGSLGAASSATLSIIDDDQPQRSDRIAPRIGLNPDTRRLRLRSIIRKGIPGSFSCSEACRAEIALRYKGYIIVGAGGGILGAPGPGRFTARLSPGGKRLLRKRLRHKKRQRLALRLRAVDPVGNARVQQLRVVVLR